MKSKKLVKLPQRQIFLKHKHLQKKFIMESIRELLGSVYDSFFQLKDNIIKWFQSLRGTNPEISNEEMPPMQDGPASRTRSTSTLPPEYDRNGFKSESKNFALKHFGLYPEENLSEYFNEGSEEEHSNQSGSDENTLNEEPEEEKI